MRNFISKFLIIPTLCFVTLSSFKAEANFNILYDSETMNIVYRIARPILDAAKIQKIKLYIVQDTKPNAFTIGGESLFINTGLVTQFPDPNVLRGVIAHEVGHILSNHVARSQVNAENQKKLAFTSLLLGIIGTAITSDPSLLMHGAMVGSHASERLILKYSRENETSADIKACELLEKAGYSADGLVTLLTYFHHKYSVPTDFRYDLTHPISSDRILLLKTKLHKPKIFKEDSKLLKDEYQMVAAKLQAFVSDKIDNKLLNPDARKYATAIIAMRRSERSKALENIDSLIVSYPNNKYFYQLKAEILTFFGDIHAIDFYKKSLSISSDPLVEIELAIAQIKLSKDKKTIKEALSVLELKSEEISRNQTILEYLAIGYNKIGNVPYSTYYRALSQKYLGNIRKAKKLAIQAKQNLPKESPLYLKNDDIILTEE